MSHLTDGQFRFGLGIEDTFVPQERLGCRALDEYELTQHYSMWHDDLALAAKTGAEVLRYGFPWYRLNPEKGVFAWDWSDRVVDRLAELGLNVIVDLMHYGTPRWLDNEFLNRDYPKRVADWAFALADRYGDRLTLWTPLNEPQINARYCGETGQWPPYLHGDDGYLQVLRALCEGIVRSQAAISDATGGKATFVHVEASLRYAEEPGRNSPRVALLNERRFLALDLVTGRVGSAHPLGGYLAEHGITSQELDWFQSNTAIPDVLGINYYPVWGTEEHYVENGVERTRTRNDWTVGLEELIQAYGDRYQVPVMLTETAVVGTPAEQMAWLDDSIASMKKMRQEGVNVVGYIWWSLFDQVEWRYREALTPVADHMIPIGLYRLVPDSVGRYERRHTASADHYRDIITAGLDSIPAAAA